MKNKNKRLVIALILTLIIFALIISVSNKELNIQGINTKQQAVQLNEEYTKEDFIFDETGKILKGFSDKGKEKYVRNGYKLILDGNVLGNIEEIGDMAFISDNNNNEETYKKSLKELEFRNLGSLKVIGISAFQDHSLQLLDLSPLKNLEKTSKGAFCGNTVAYAELKKKMKINFEGLENLKEIGIGSFGQCGIDGPLDLSSLKNLRSIGENAFELNNITNIDFNNLKNLSEIKSNTFRYNTDLEKVDLTIIPNTKVDGKAFDEKTKIKLTYNQYRYMLDGINTPVYNYLYYYSTGGDNKYKVSMLDDYCKKYIEMNNEIQEINEKVQNTQEQMSKLFLNENENKAWLENKGFLQKEKNIMQEIENKVNYVMGEYTSELDALKPWEKSDEELEQGLKNWKLKRDELLKKYNDYKNLVLEELDTKIKEKIEKLNTELGKIKENIKTNDNSKEIEDGINELKGKCIIQSSIDNLKTKLENLKKFQKTVNDNITQLDTKVTELSTNNQERIKENTELNTLMKNLTAEANTLKEYKLNLENKIKELETEINKLEAFDCEGINADLSKIEKDIENLENNDNTKKKDITSLNEKLVNAEKAGKVTEDVKQGLLNDLTTLESKQNAEKEELAILTKELEDFKNTNGKVLEIDSNIKAKADALATKIKTLKENIEKDDTTITDLKTRIEKLEVINPAKEKAKEELNKLKQEVDKTIPNENTFSDAIKEKLKLIEVEVDGLAKEGIVKKAEKEELQNELNNTQKEIEAEKAKVKDLQDKLNKIKEDNKDVISDEEVAKLVKEIQDKITKENDKIAANETYKGQIEEKLNNIQVIDIAKLTADLSAIEAKVNASKTKDDAKKEEITNSDTKVEEAEEAGKITEETKQGLLNDLTALETKQKAEKEELANIEKELKAFKETNAKALEVDSNLKAKEEALTTKLNNLKASIINDDSTISDLRRRIEGLEVIDPAKEKAKKELNTLKQEVDKEIPDENTEVDKIKAELDKINTEVDNEAKDGVIKKEDKEAIQTKLDNVQKEIDAEKEKVKKLQDKLDKIKEENKAVIVDEEIANIAKEIQDKITKENDKITANETYKGQIENKLNNIQVVDLEKLTADLSAIEKRTNELENNDNAKKSDITKLEEEVKTAETNTGTDVLGKKKLEESIAYIKKRQEDEKAERNTLEQELTDLITGNEKGLISETDLKTKADALKEKINNLKDTIEKDDTKIKELENRIGNIKVLDVKDIEELKKKVTDLESINKKANEDIAKNKKIIEDLNASIEKLKKDNSDAVDKLTKEKEGLKNTNKELEKKNKELNNTITELKAQIEQLNNLKEENKDLNNRIANLEAKVLEAEAKANDLKDKLEKCSKHGKDLEEQIKELQNIIKAQDEKIKKLEQEKKDLEKRNKELEEKNKLNEEELKEKELLEKKIKELESKVKTLEAEKARLAKAAMDKKEKEQKDREKEQAKENNGKVADVNNNNKPSTNDNTVASKAKKNNSKNTSNNKLPHAGAGSVIMLTIITFGVIIYTKKVVNKK